MTDVTIRVSDPPEVTDASRDVRFVSSPSGTVHERDESSSDDHDYEFHPTCGQRLPDGSHWGVVDAENAEAIAEDYPNLSFCARCFSRVLRLNEIRRTNR